MSESIFKEGFKTEPYWWEAARPSADHAERLPEQTEVAIVGSGYSGLSTALELARSGTSVTVLDREEIGYGASSRNGGLLSTEPKFASAKVLRERLGAAHAKRVIEDGRATFTNLKGVTLVGRAEVMAIRGQPGDFVLETSRGMLRAREAVVGTNGYTSELTPWQRRRLVPIGSYIIATEEIGEQRVESMFQNFCTMSNTQRVLFYYRPSPDHKRILFGGRASFGVTDARTAAPTLHKYLTWVYPQLREVRLTHAWTGNVAFTFDYLPHMGTREGIHYLMGCNGSGVAMMSYLGRQTALKILGKTNRPCAFEDIAFNTRPGYSGNPWFLPVVGNWYRFRDHVDRFFAR
jgi:glycine/D-amino acid oxidase-like deaminating enzyme